ncbi:uncharacterized protein LOC124293439 [Neodiprion lecontei]|uniref:Uncharacterized protein LOC124293439 n=1 Tax=Neodiprion lecontei TaxID=441921 RepID=A0ABM3FQF8_NEOLC|nr:uncharacterized protein LOC124293439 [Neodiprion lecontei]
MLKMIKGHTSTFGCEKCCIAAVSLQRKLHYLVDQTNHRKRCDEDYFKEDPDTAHIKVDYDVAAEYMTNVIDNGTSEDGINIQPITQKKVSSENLSPDDDTVEETQLCAQHQKETLDIQMRQYLQQQMEQTQVALATMARANQAQIAQVQGALRPECFPEWPISSLDVFDAFNEMIQIEEHRSYLVRRLSTVGGPSQRQVVMNMMKLLMTNTLAMEYNWAGREKRSFKKTKLRYIIIEAAKLACKDNPVESSDLIIENAIKDWLKLATSRYTYSIAGKKSGNGPTQHPPSPPLPLPPNSPNNRRV